MRQRLLAAGLAITLAAGASAANASSYVVGPIVGPDDSATGAYGDNFTAGGAFTSTITFLLAKAGKLSTSITTTSASSSTNIDFSSATLNGSPFSLGPTGSYEKGSIQFLNVAAGLQTIVVKGSTGFNGSYAGQFSFVPVVEPATWGLMILGFAGVGAMQRRRHAMAAAALA
jgi:hypothetical protein